MQSFSPLASKLREEREVTDTQRDRRFFMNFYWEAKKGFMRSWRVPSFSTYKNACLNYIIMGVYWPSKNYKKCF